MSVRKFSTASIRTGTKSSKFWDQTTFTSHYQSIATTTVGSGGAANVEFTSIPATYTHLQIRFLARWTAAGTGENALRMSVNGTILDRSHYLLGNGSSASASSLTLGYISSIPNSGQDGFCGGVIDILDYQDTNKNKTVRALSGYDNNNVGTSLILFYSGLRISTTATTSLLFDSPSTNFAQYSHFALYGIKGA